MSRKVSRTGKKKKSQYGPGTPQSPQTQFTREEEERYRIGRRTNLISIGMLVLAMVGILFSPQLGVETTAYVLAMIGSYLITVAAGVLMMYNVRYTPESRQRMGRITGGVMIFVGVFGIINTLMITGVIGSG